LKLLRDESIESHVIGLTAECHVFKTTIGRATLPCRFSELAMEGYDLIVEFTMMRFIELAIFFIARCTRLEKWDSATVPSR
jgi:hypothetical protein